MPLLSHGDTGFAQSVSKTLGWKSSELDELLAALVRYQTTPSDLRLRELNWCLYEWKKKNRKEAGGNGRGSRANALRVEIDWTAANHHWMLWHPPQHAIADVIGELNRCKNFACTDVGTFAGDINAALSAAQKAAIYQKGTSQGQSTGRPIIPSANVTAGDWDPDSLQAAHTRVFGASAGECTSFAKAAAHVLATGKVRDYIMPRIEIVSYRNHRQVPRRNKDGSVMFKKDASGNPTTEQAMSRQYVTHVFCVVGRTGVNVAHDGVMPDSANWGTDARIVDCWLGALGYECSFPVAIYPKQGYLTTGLLFKEMDSYAGPNAVM